MQILVPIAGPSLFFRPEEYHFPKPLTEVAGRIMIEHVVEGLERISQQTNFIFVCSQDDIAQHSLDGTLRMLCPGATIIGLRKPTKGALCSCLMAVDAIDPDKPLVVSNGDQLITADLSSIIAGFTSDAAAAGVVTFDSVHPRWSYVRLEGDLVVEAVEKRVISRNAIAGLYWYDSGRRFIEAGMQSIAGGNGVGGAFYIAPTMNEIILRGGVVRASKVPANSYSSFYSPAKIHEYEQSCMAAAQRRAQPTPGTPAVRVVIPAAGEGSRFAKAGYPKPKPFLDVLGQTMIQTVIDNVQLPGAQMHLLLRSQHIEQESALVADMKAKGYGIQSVDRLTEGTACTLLLARKTIDDDVPILVANSDQYVDFDIADFFHDCLDRNLDGSILVFRDPKLDPKWSFARTDANGLVTEVAEKKVISDLATVGIYLFRRGSEFVRAALDMIVANDRINNEFYTCPVYNYMIRDGARIGVYEISPSAMHGLGTPEDLTAYISRKQAAKLSTAERERC